MAVRLDKLVIMQKLSAMLAAPYAFDYTDLTGAHTLTFTPTAVYRGRKTVSAVEAPWAISVLEAPRAIVGSGADLEGRQRLEDWTLNIQGWPPENRVNPSDPAYAMAAAVRQRLGRLIDCDPKTGDARYPNDILFGHMVNSVTFGATIVSPASDGVSEVAFWYMPLVISLVQQTRAV